MKKIITVLFLLSASFCFLFAHGAKDNRIVTEQNILFTDSCGRCVEIPQEITKVVPSGYVCTMFMESIAPEYLCSLCSKPTDDMMKILPDYLLQLPVTGQFYGGKSNLNLEEILSCGAQIVIDMGSYKKGLEKDLDDLQNQLGIPCIFIEADLDNMSNAFRTLGNLLYGKDERAAEISHFIDSVLELALNNSKKIKSDEIVRIMYTGGPEGLGTNPKGSDQAQVIELIGADNVVELGSFSSKDSTNIVNEEQLYLFNPDLIIFAPDSFYSYADKDPRWQILRAIEKKQYYEVPQVPYNWLSNPPSLNMICGILWLGNLVYPQYYDYDIVSSVQQLFHVLWNVDLSEAEISEILKT